MAGDNGLGRNGIPTPAGAGGGSSSSSLEPGGPPRLNHFKTTLRLRPEGGSRSILPAVVRQFIERTERLQNRIYVNDSATIEPA